ncbi:c-type cytochrome [Phreatobacter oligotrophus]|uniref:Cytochrome c553 n=1 Tax=Phreatobacter oligotrophus TaxID=1122261 RepID=A0A2T4YZ01_9HYPH|nr:c-type cytochrome [Phreatobacter oligotrophus]PTM51906.1 cytochrome c553 [Phreatobacter oligotrophus]
MTRLRPALLGLALALAPAAALAQSAPAPLIALSCAGCHGPAGAGEGSVPRIAGYDREAFVQSWAAFRANERPASIMNRIARGFTDAEVAELAAYFAALR